MARHGAHGSIACTPDARCVSDMERLRQRAQGEKRSAQITRSGMGYQGARPARHGIASRNARRGRGQGRCHHHVGRLVEPLVVDAPAAE
jgi:hypothetical protein